MNKNKILLVGYGGTIVMVVKDKKVQPAENVEEIFELVPRIREYADIELEILSNVDSTNVVPQDWTNIANFLAEKRDEYDGFLIAHGTNTMAYTASALSLALGVGFGKPVVVTGSQLPLTVWGNDGMFNLENSVKVLNEAVAQNINETMIVFNDLVLRAGRAVKVSESDFRAFDSPSYPHIGHIKSTGVSFTEGYVRKGATDAFEPKTAFAEGVLSVDLTPGQSPFLIRSILNNRACRGVILKSHGAGSVPTIGEYSFLPLIQEAARDLGLPVLVSTKFVGGNSFKETNDAPAIEAIDMGAIPTGDLTDVMAEVKLMWLLAQGITEVKDIRREIVTDYVGEVTGIVVA